MTDNKSGEQNAGDRITTSTEQDSVVVSFDRDGNSSVSTTGESLRQEFDAEGAALSPEELAELEADGHEVAAGDDVQQGDEPGDKDDAEGDGDDGGEELPEWEDGNDDVVSQYDAKYITQDEGGGEVLNFEAFNAEFAKDRGEGKRDLNAGTRKYLKTRFGISDTLIDSHLQGVLAQEREAASTFHSQFGSDADDGKKNYEAMFAWAKADGYTAEQKARYNAAMKVGGEAALEQIELLKTRYLTKTGGKLPSGDTSRQSSQIGLGARKARAVSPTKNATSGATSSSAAVQPFANAEEHRHAQNAAMKLSGKERADKLAEVRTRLVASTFWKA